MLFKQVKFGLSSSPLNEGVCVCACMCVCVSGVTLTTVLVLDLLEEDHVCLVVWTVKQIDPSLSLSLSFSPPDLYCISVSMLTDLTHLTMAVHVPFIKHHWKWGAAFLSVTKNRGAQALRSKWIIQTGLWLRNIQIEFGATLFTETDGTDVLKDERCPVCLIIQG